MQRYAFAVLVFYLKLATWTTAIPLSDCYALNKENYLYDFTDKVGRELELEGKDSDFVLRFCIDAQNRSKSGYINYGRYSPQSMIKGQVDDIDFFQEYNYGDLLHCEHVGNDFTGRKAEVQVICGFCHNVPTCKDEFGCICNVTYTHNLCKAKVLVAVNCSKPVSHTFPEISIGLRPRGNEVVKNGIIQREYGKSFHSDSFESGQNSLSLYLTSTPAFFQTFAEVDIQVQPSKGLLLSVEIKSSPSIISETEKMVMLQVDWKCEMTRDNLYEVSIRIPIEGYDPISFFLLKQCRTIDTQKEIKGSIFKVVKMVSLISILVGMLGFGISYSYKKKKKFEPDTENLWPLMRSSSDHVNVEDNIEPVVEVEVPLV